MLRMFRIRHKLKVTYMIIENIVVYMMNNFTRPFQLSTKMLFHYPSMLWNKFSIFKKDLVTFFVKSTFASKTNLCFKRVSGRVKSHQMHFTKGMSFMFFGTTYYRTLFIIFSWASHKLNYKAQTIVLSTSYR